MNGFLLPDMQPNIDTNGAVIGADTTLYTSEGVWHHIAGSQNRVFLGIALEKLEKAHM